VSQAHFEVRGTWDGRALTSDEFARFDLEIDRGHGALVLRVEAADYGDPAPTAPAGSLEGLWEYEVVELFLLGSNDRYLEIELGPRGHHLGILLEGRRRVVESGLPIEFEVDRDTGAPGKTDGKPPSDDSRWSGEARLDLAWLPDGVHAANAYAIHGTGAARRYLAAHPVPGPRPDFHRLECFGPVSLGALGAPE
jgi:hypothetical protein